MLLVQYQNEKKKQHHDKSPFDSSPFCAYNVFAVASSALVIWISCFFSLTLLTLIDSAVNMRYRPETGAMLESGRGRL